MKRTGTRTLAAIGGVLLTFPLTAAPSMARPPDDSVERVVQLAPRPHGVHCPLQRIGTQLVRCDRLTGNGLAAPAHIPEWR